MAIKVMLDAGHYGKYNRSPVVPAYWESEMAWKLHLKLKAELEKYGIEVFTTRKEQTKDMPVFERGKSAKGCDMFISLHSNGVSPKPGYGWDSVEKTDRVVVYYPFDGRDGSKELAMQFSASIADLMEVSQSRIGTREEPAGTEYYGVMRGARKVGVPVYFIIEHSFHTNRHACEWLLDDRNLDRLARLEASIIAQYYGLETEPLKGDVDGDGQITAKDYLLVKKHVLETLAIPLTEEQLKIADMNGDGKVDLKDYILIKKEVLNS